MIKYLKRLWFGYRVCKKFGATLTLASLSPKDVGRALFVSRKGPNYLKPSIIRIEITASIWCDEFYETLAHEIGHVMDHKVSHYGYFKRDYVGFTGVPNSLGSKSSGGKVNRQLYAELRASRCARLLLRSWGKLEGESMNYLNRCYGSYLSGYPNDGAADASYKGMKYLKAVK